MPPDPVETLESQETSSERSSDSSSLVADLWDSMKETLTGSAGGKSGDSTTASLDFDEDIYGQSAFNVAPGGELPAQQPSGDTGGTAGPVTAGDTGRASGPPAADAGTRAAGGGGGSGSDTIQPEMMKASIGDSLRDLWRWVVGDDTPQQADRPAKPVDQRAVTAPGSEYRGEGIRRDLPAESHPWTVSVNPDTGRPETLEEIARSQMPGDATDDEVRRYATELQRVNRIADPNNLREGQELILPGHNPNGDMIVKTADGITRTYRQDGSARTEHPNGTSLEYRPGAQGSGYTEVHRGPNAADNYEVSRTPDGHGGYTERRTGNPPTDNYEISRTPDGRYLIKDNTTATPVDKTEYNRDNPDPRVEKARLTDLADQKITDPAERQRFHEDMDRFERRAREQNLSGQEKARFYHEVSRLLEAADSTNQDLPNAVDRVRIAEQIMNHAANPGGIDQGNNGTCGAAALESQMFSRNPSAAAKMIVDVATTGEFTTTSGRRVRPDASVVRPDAEAQKNPTPDGERTYASQLFQGTAITIEYPGYRKGTPSGPGDTGETVPDPDRLLQRMQFPGLRPDQIQDMNRQIAGDGNPLTIIENSRRNPGDGQVHVNNEAELRQQLKDLKEQGRLPAVIFVDSNNEPFWTDSRAGLAGGSGGGHFVTITDYDDATGKVTIDNQWGARTDHSNINVRDLYIATERQADTDHLQHLKDAVAANQREGRFNPVMELQLLRERKAAGELNERQYAQAMERVYSASERHWNEMQRNNQPIDDDERSRAAWAFYQMQRQLPEATRRQMDARLKAARERDSRRR